MSVVRADRGRDSRSIVGAPPRANLLPPEIAQVAKLSRQRRGLVYMVLLAIVLVGLGYAYVSLLAIQAKLDLDLENQQTAPILAEQATYSEVTSITARLEATKAAKAVASSTALDFQAYIDYVNGTLPAGGSISSYSFAGTLPTVSYEPPAEGSASATVATANFAVILPGLSSVSTWLHALETIPGYAGATISSVSGSGATYSVDMSMKLNMDALMNQPEEGSN